MKKFNPYTTVENGAHLSLEQLQAYQTGQLTGLEMQAVEKHNLSCEFCADALEGMQAFSPEANTHCIEAVKTRLSKKEQTSIRGMYWKVAAVICFLVVSAGIFILLNKIQGPDQPIANFKERDAEKMEDFQPRIPQPIAETESAPLISNTDNDKQEPPSKAMQESLAVTSDQTAAFARKVPVPDNKVDFTDGFIGEPPLKGADTEPIASVEMEQTEERKLDDILVNGTLADSDVLLKEALDSNSLGNDLHGRIAGMYMQSAPLKASPTQPQVQLQGVASINSRTRAGQLVRGKVISQLGGEPIPGVSVEVFGTNTRVSSNIAGEYEIVLPASAAPMLHYKFMGFESKLMAVHDTTSFLIARLKEDYEALEKLTVTANKLEKEEKVQAYPVQAAEKGYLDTPKPIIGQKAYKEYLVSNIKYSEEARQANVEGSVILRLSISASGKIGSVAVIKGLGFGLDEEAIRLVKEGPAWQPAKKNGVAVAQKVTVEIKFELDE